MIHNDQRYQLRCIFCWIDEQIGEKGTKTVYFVHYVPKSPYTSLRSLPAVTAYLFPICTRSMKQGKVIRNPGQMGNIFISYFYIIVVLPSQWQKLSAYIKSVWQAHSQSIGVICKQDADFTFKTSSFWKSPKDACCTSVSWDRGCNPQAASTRACKLLKPVNLTCFDRKWINDDHLV